jgi:hypothetical protein
MRSSFPILFAFALILGGCTAGKSVLPTETGGFSSPRAALSAIQRVNDTNTIYQVTAKVSLTSPQGKLGFRLAVIMQSPDKLRIESIPILGPPDFFLTAKNGRFKAYLPGNQEFITGNATPNNLSRFLPLAWSAERWVAVLLGNRPDASSGVENLRGKMEGLFYRVDVLDGELIRESLWINPENKRLEKMEFMSPEGLQNRVIYAWGLKYKDWKMPENVKIEPGNGTTILITCTDFQTAKVTEINLFDLNPPGDDVPIQEWD